MLGVPGTAQADGYQFGAPTNLGNPTGLPNYDDNSGYPSGLGRISCSSPGNCVAISSYPDDDAGDMGTDYISEVDGQWGQWQVLQTPDGDILPGVDGIACPADGSCIAVGSAEDCPDGPSKTCSGDDTLEWIYAGGSFADGEVIGAPNDLASNAGYIPSAVACASAAYCVAVGSYETSGAEQETMAASGPVSGLGSVKGIAPQTALYVPSVACPPSDDTCVIAGTNEVVNDAYPVAVNDIGGQLGTFTAVGTNISPYSPSPVKISCPALNGCTTLSYYRYSYTSQFFDSNHQHPDGSWGTPVQTDFMDSPFSLACSGVGSCPATGYTTPESGGGLPFAYTEVSGTWGPEQDLDLPAGATTDAFINDASWGRSPAVSWAWWR